LPKRLWEKKSCLIKGNEKVLFKTSMRVWERFVLILAFFYQKPWIAVPGRRVPRVRLQSPRHCVPAGLSARAVPAGVTAWYENPLVVTNSEENDFTTLKRLFSCIPKLSKCRWCAQ